MKMIARVWTVLLALGLAPADRAMASPLWVRANFHAHSGQDSLRDDGTEPVAVLHGEMREHGLDFSVHSPHSSVNTGARAPAAFRLQRAREAHLGIAGLTTALGEELTVADGPRYQSRTSVLGHDAPGNLNHLTVFGMNELVPSGLPLREACALVHREGGVCIVNHPGPGPMMWEEGLWEAPQNRDQIDGLEVYNGQALAVAGIDFEGRYLEVTACAGLGLHIAAVTGADTHGPQSVERARGRLLRAVGAEQVLRLFGPPASGASGARPELDAATLVRADSGSEAAVIRGLRRRRTVATYGLPELTVDLPGLGEVVHQGAVRLRLTLSRKLAEVTLYREGRPVQTWRDAAYVAWDETLARPAAYVFAGRDGAGRFLTSAVWYEPPPGGDGSESGK